MTRAELIELQRAIERSASAALASLQDDIARTAHCHPYYQIDIANTARSIANNAVSAPLMELEFGSEEVTK